MEITYNVLCKLLYRGKQIKYHDLKRKQIRNKQDENKMSLGDIKHDNMGIQSPFLTILFS